MRKINESRKSGKITKLMTTEIWSLIERAIIIQIISNLLSLVLCHYHDGYYNSTHNGSNDCTSTVIIIGDVT